jgi:hypothetical protein
MIIAKYHNWIEENTPDTGSESPKTGRKVTEQRITIKPVFIIALSRYIGKLNS